MILRQHVNPCSSDGFYCTYARPNVYIHNFSIFMALGASAKSSKQSAVTEAEEATNKEELETCRVTVLHYTGGTSEA